jgi:hypothetical protein
VEIHLPPAVTAPLVTQKLRDGSYEADEANAAERCVKEGFRVLELGAGIGYVTAICARGPRPRTCSRWRPTPPSSRSSKTTLPATAPRM